MLVQHVWVEGRVVEHIAVSWVEEHISVSLGVDEWGGGAHLSEPGGGRVHLSVAGVEEHISVSLEVGNTSQYPCHVLVLKG